MLHTLVEGTFSLKEIGTREVVAVSKVLNMGSQRSEYLPTSTLVTFTSVRLQVRIWTL